MNRSRTAIFTGQYLSLHDLREYVMISLADLDGMCEVRISQRPGGMNGGVATTEITVEEM